MNVAAKRKHVKREPSVAWMRSAEAAKWPSRILSSLTFPLAKKR